MRKRTHKQDAKKVERSLSSATEQPRQGDNTTVNHRQQYMALLASHTADAIIQVDDQFRVNDINPAASQLLGFSSEKAQDHSCMQVLRCQNLNRMTLCGTSSCPLTQALQERKSLPNEELLLGSDPNHTCEVTASITPIMLDQRQYVVFTARDLSALKVANRVRSNFVSMVSHELRTPLNSVHGFIELILQGHMGDLLEEQKLYLGYAQEGVQQLVSIVEDILFMTRSDLGQFEVKQQEVYPQSLVRQVVRSLQPQALKAEVELRSEIPNDIPVLAADPQRIKQVLNNLIVNAVKFTPPGGTVTVQARRHDEHFVLISIIDTGYGIPPEDRAHIFERFYQSNHSQQSKMGGYGLGLSIAKLIVEQHGGMIDFETAINKGTTFYFTLPILPLMVPEPKRK